MFNYPLSHYAADAAIANTNKDIRHSKPGSLTTWDPSQKLLYLTFQCGSVHNNRMVWGFFVEAVYRIVHSTIHRRSADDGEAAIADLAY